MLGDIRCRRYVGRNDNALIMPQTRLGRAFEFPDVDVQGDAAGEKGTLSIFTLCRRWIKALLEGISAPAPWLGR